MKLDNEDKYLRDNVRDIQMVEKLIAFICHIIVLKTIVSDTILLYNNAVLCFE